MAQIYEMALFDNNTIGLPFTINLLHTKATSIPPNTILLYAESDGNLYVQNTAGVISQVILNTSTTLGTLTGLTLNGLFKPGVYFKASLPAATAIGQVIFVSDAIGLHHTGSLAFALGLNNTQWTDVTTGNTVV